MRIFMTLLAALSFSTPAIAGLSETNGYDKFLSVADIPAKREQTVLSWVHVTTHGSTDRETRRIMSYVRKALKAAGPFFAQYGAVRCGADKLDVFFIKDSQLNDQQLMKFISWKKWNYMAINGAYDAISSPGGSSIFLSKTPSGKSVEQLVAHEVAHYWQAQHCGLSTSEETARKFEKHFVRSR